MGYDSLNWPVLHLVPPKTRSILDLGCGGASMGALLKSRLGCAVTGVTMDPEEAAMARARIDRVEIADLSSFDPSTLGTFDCVICSHVLEHLAYPKPLLERVRACLDADGTLIVALPNGVHCKQRLQFARGRFRYTAGGPMDETHLRFYDYTTAAELLTGSGFAIVSRAADGHFPLSRVLGSRLAQGVNQSAVSWFPGLFGWQFVFSCRIASRASI